jgi:hypothetical protein
MHPGNIYIKYTDAVLVIQYVALRDGVPYDCLHETDNS